MEQSFDHAFERSEDNPDIVTINMGPSHPATHGVLRLVLKLDGERVTDCVPHLGYLHRGMEKIAENRTYLQFIPYTDRMDYLSPLAANVGFALAVEELLGVKVPPRCEVIRVFAASWPASARTSSGWAPTPWTWARGRSSSTRSRTASGTTIWWRTSPAPG